MFKKTMKGAALAAVLGTVFQFGGCLGDFFGSGFWLDAARSAAFEWVWDNDGIFDFFGDDAPGLIS